MSKNDSNVVVHNHIESFPQIQSMTVVFFGVLGVGVVIVLLLLLTIIIMMILVCKNSGKKSSGVPHSSRETSKESLVERSLSRENLTHSAALNDAAYLDDDEAEINSNIHHLPMSVFKCKLNDRFGNSPDSLPSAIGALFPGHHDGEIISQKQPKFKTFGGKIFAATKLKSTVNSKPESKTSRSEHKSSSGRDPRTSSLEWDYFESKPYGYASNASNGSEIVDKNAVDVCWV